MDNNKTKRDYSFDPWSDETDFSKMEGAPKISNAVLTPFQLGANAVKEGLDNLNLEDFDNEEDLQIQEKNEFQEDPTGIDNSDQEPEKNEPESPTKHGVTPISSPVQKDWDPYQPPAPSQNSVDRRNLNLLKNKLDETIVDGKIRRDLPWIFRSNLAFIKLNKGEQFELLEIMRSATEFSDSKDYLRARRDRYPGLYNYYNQFQLLAKPVQSKARDIIMTFKNGIRSIWETEELMSLLMEIALDQREHEIASNTRAELDQYKALCRQVQDSLSLGVRSMKEAVQGINADRANVQAIHKELKEMQLNKVVYKSVPSPIVKEAKPTSSRKTHVTYHLGHEDVEFVYPGETKTFGISANNPSEELIAKIKELRKQLDLKEKKIINEINSGFTRELDLIFVNHGFETE